MEIDAENNGSATGMSLLPLLPVAAETHGEGLPYAPENWPEPGDIWGWRTGRRVAQNGHFLDRYLYLPARLSHSEIPGSSRKHRLCFPSKLSVERYIKSNYPETDIEAFFALFSWKIPSIPSTPTKGNSDPIVAVPLRQISHDSYTEQSASESESVSSGCKVKNKMCNGQVLKKAGEDSPAMPCDICCAEPGFCRDCCCILCSKIVDSAYRGYNYIQCQEKINNNICGHISHMECALRCRMAGTVGGSIGLDAEYYCRRCDGRTDLIPHVNKLLRICKAIDSKDDIENILNLGACLLRGSKKAIAKKLLRHFELANLKLKCGFDDIWEEEEEGNHAAYSAGFTENGHAPMDVMRDESPLNVRNSESCGHPPELVELEVEIDQALQDLRKSQEFEYKLAEERLHAQKNYLNNLYQQLKSEKSELARPRSSSSSSVVSDHAIRKREEQIRLESQKLEDMKKVAHGFGSTPHYILREHFGLGIAD
ncbi:protein OBERON 2-like [Prosopis cineraria]|uniref:protein OBERON 2-like n=1 Tax=Prosopis cineraria TaxID=364024 RepID=UPI00240F7972|nr:protein OBERON 2-like [Prosopis cineraria]XP_054821900.1 protein OBERON 2-like [Prosopis cineraria]